MSFGDYIDISKDEDGIWDYKRYNLYKTEEIDFLVEIPDKYVYEVCKTFLKEHYRFINGLIKNVQNSFYSSDEIKQDIDIILYQYIYENKNIINPFIEHYKSRCFFTIKKAVYANLYSKTREFNKLNIEVLTEEYEDIDKFRNYEAVDSNKDLNLEEEEYYLDNILASDNKLFKIKNILEDILNENSKLNFYLKFSLDKGMVCKKALMIVYGYNEKESVDKNNILRDFFESRKNNKKFKKNEIGFNFSLIDLFNHQKNLDENIVEVADVCLHKKINFVEEYEGSKQIKKSNKKIINFLLRDTYLSVSDIKNSKFPIELVCKILYESYYGLYAPLGLILDKNEDETKFRLRKCSLDSDELKNHINIHYEFKYVR